MATTRGRRIPDATVARLPVYLRILLELADHDAQNVSSEELADLAGVNAAKVRKDLSHLGTYGTRGVGYEVPYLIYQVRRELGLTHDWPVVIVGAGNLGQALAGYGGFGARGFPVAGIVDIDESKVGTVIGGHHRLAADELGAMVRAPPCRHRCGRHARGGGPRSGEPARGGRGHQHSQLRTGGAVGAPGHPGPQGRPGRRAADPQLSRAATSQPHRGRHRPGPALHGRRRRRLRRRYVHRRHRCQPPHGAYRCWNASPRARELGKAITGLTGRANIREAAVLSTCNRTEVFAVAETIPRRRTPTSANSSASSAG